MGQNYGLDLYGAGTYGSNPASSQPVSYYLNLLTSQYQGSPKFLAWLAFVLQMVDDVTAVMEQIDEAFDLDTAVGVQLDILGQRIGEMRTVGFQPSNGVSPVLDDATYRLLLQAKVAQNYFNGLVDGLQEFWSQLFPGGRITILDSQQMSATIVLTGAFTSIQKDLVQQGYIVPQPQGVLFDFAFSGTPILGFDQNTALIAGFDTGKFS